MLKCKDVAAHASAYVDKSLSWQDKLRWQLHLAICHHCRRFVRHLRLSMLVGRQVGQSPLSQDEAQAIVRKVIEHDHH